MARQNETAVFGGGCFWCTEAIFQNLKGVNKVTSGYAGGDTPSPTYEQLHSADTGHAEVIKIDFDPAVIDFENLLTVFFATHNPTTPNRQGNDVGAEYRSIILYNSDKQKIAAESYLKKIKSEFTQPIVTEIKPLDRFYPAEDYHQNFYNNNKSQPYCRAVISPKLKKFKESHPELLK